MLTRDSMLWWLGIAGAVVIYLSAGESPSTWTWAEWMRAAAFVIATVSGKLATSPLRGEFDGRK